MTRLRDWVGFFAPFGRPKWASSSTIAPWSDSSRIVGIAARIRVSAATAPSDIGTLRSTRTRTRLPVTSPMSSRVRKPVMSNSVRPEPVEGPFFSSRKTGLPPDLVRGQPKRGFRLQQPRDHAGGIDHAVRETPFIVVPAHDANQLAFEHRGFEAVDGRAGRAVVVIDQIGRAHV